ncbi:MAG: (d)CMP kinase [Gammaproteobacteria bacterium]|nr:(d)CMP kinase [Gammaproteobacteria bacterium]
MPTDKVKVITIDGPSGTGKGTVAILLAKKLGWHYLDSGLLYRGLAWGILRSNIDPNDGDSVSQVLPEMDIQVYELGRVLCNGEDITAHVRSEEISQAASKISAQPAVRQRLLELQHQAGREPGLVTDGRDMGTVVFPGAQYKFYLDANPAERAKRRHNQLKQQGINVSLRNIEQDLLERDTRDAERAICPLKPALDAVVIDTSDMTIAEVLAKVMADLPMCS